MLSIGLSALELQKYSKFICSIKQGVIDPMGNESTIILKASINIPDSEENEYSIRLTPIYRSGDIHAKSGRPLSLSNMQINTKISDVIPGLPSDAPFLAVPTSYIRGFANNPPSLFEGIAEGINFSIKDKLLNALESGVVSLNGPTLYESPELSSLDSRTVVEQNSIEPGIS